MYKFTIYSYLRFQIYFFVLLSNTTANTHTANYVPLATYWRGFFALNAFHVFKLTDTGHSWSGIYAVSRKQRGWELSFLRKRRILHMERRKKQWLKGVPWSIGGGKRRERKRNGGGMEVRDVRILKGKGKRKYRGRERRRAGENDPNPQRPFGWNKRLITVLKKNAR